ncbi:sugar phosphate isomerase/epimerase [Saccharopolyspora lacisalsi]|uniref:Sugar phosphate isomerase/epimerase n=1 Tax=Halosaccharopolyspora lacisalsi TaxID=1000566 RepID=A0A839DXS0_9PSEU|nr:sugar phosphate isomerase/epimerase [Halosaccharopolyspora lacisalsi]MBA8826284.1 sugar phosphate isomerase/epimerase [Halosaccharopolyspora lacisalsi]
MISPRLGCSTISLRDLPLPRALERIAEAGFAEVDLGALPGVCEHVPVPLPPEEVESISRQVRASGLRVRTVNADIGPMDDPDPAGGALAEHLRGLVALAVSVGSPAIMLPCGDYRDRRPTTDSEIRAVADTARRAADIVASEGLRLDVEAPHSMRLCHDTAGSHRLADELDGSSVGIVLDVSHVVASGGDSAEAARALADRVRHVHLRDAVPGDIHRSIGRGHVDFGGFVSALEAAGYTGHYSLELETDDVGDEQRPAEASRAGAEISRLLATTQERLRIGD